MSSLFGQISLETVCHKSITKALDCLLVNHFWFPERIHPSPREPVTFVESIQVEVWENPSDGLLLNPRLSGSLPPHLERKKICPDFTEREKNCSDFTERETLFKFHGKWVVKKLAGQTESMKLAGEARNRSEYTDCDMGTRQLELILIFVTSASWASSQERL